MKWLLKTTLATLSVGSLALLYAAVVERVRVQVDRYELEIDAPALPPSGLTILHLSDFHFGTGSKVQARKVARLRRLLAAERYDVLALTGDLIHDMSGFPIALALVESLAPRLAAFACPGNHDYAEYSMWGVFGHTWRESGTGGWLDPADLGQAIRKLAGFAWKVLHNELVRLPVAFNDVPAMLAELAARGVTPLVNRAALVQVGEAAVWFAGLDDALEGQPDPAAALGQVPDGVPLVLLAHNPDAWLDRRLERADLVLAGHTHGGQIRLPIVGAVHTQGTHLRRSRPAGWFQRGRTQMFVSRGLGESIPLRFGVRPQAALIRLVSSRVASDGPSSRTAAAVPARRC